MPQKQKKKAQATEEELEVEKSAEELWQRAQKEQDYANQEQTHSYVDLVQHSVPSSSKAGGNLVSVSGIELIPFMPMEEDEVPDLNTKFSMTKQKRGLLGEQRRRWTLEARKDSW